MYKTLGDYKWTALFKNHTISINNTIVNPMEKLTTDDNDQYDFFNSDDDSSILVSAQNLQLSLQSIKAVSVCCNNIIKNKQHICY